MQLFKTLNSLRGDGITNGRRFLEGFLVSFAFLIIEMIIIQYHEVWRDEIETWAIAINSHSIYELFYNSRYEGHPKLWFLILYGLLHFTHNIYWVQVMHVCIAAVTIFILNYFSPFSLLKNIWISFGYYFAYEYSIISRNYGIEVLFLFLITGLWIKHKGKYLLLISILFFLMLQTNAYGAIVAMVYFGYMILCLFESKSLKPVITLIALLIFLSGLVITVISMIPPADSGAMVGWVTHWDYQRFIITLSLIERSYLPLPLFMHEFWNSNFLDYLPNEKEEIKSIFSGILLILATALFYKNKKVLFLLFAGTFAVFLFCYTKNLGYMRHHGHLFMLFMVCCWLYYDEQKNSNNNDEITINFIGKLHSFASKYLLNFILFIQLFAAIISISKDIKYPFSNIVNVSNYLKSHSLDTMKLVGEDYPQTMSVAALLNTEMYNPRSHKTEKFILWDNSRKPILTVADTEKLIFDINDFSQRNNSRVILILTYRFKNEPSNWTLINYFGKALIWDENYFIFTVDPPKSPVN